MNRVYEDKNNVLNDYVSKFKSQHNDIGVIYAIGNQVKGLIFSWKLFI